MKLNTKFLASSIVVCTLIISLVGGGSFLIRRQEKIVEKEVEKTEYIYDQTFHLQILLSEQVNLLKDFLLLGKQNIDNTEYQNKISNFIKILDELESVNINSNLTQVNLIRYHYNNLIDLAQELQDQETTLEEIKSNLQMIKSFENEIKNFLQDLAKILDQNNNNAIHKLDQFREKIIIFQLIFIFLIILIFILQFRLIIFPFIQSLKTLEEGTKKIAKGDLTYQLKIETGDEIQTVSQEFNVMTNKLYNLYNSLENKVVERTQELAKINEELQVEIEERMTIEETLKDALETTKRSQKLLTQIINATSDWIFVKDVNFRYSLVNQAMANTLGKTPAEIVGKNDLEMGFSQEEVFGNPEKSMRGFREDDQNVLNGQIIHNPFDPATDSNGKIRIYDTQKMPLIDDHGEIFGILAFCKDFTDRYEAEHEVKQKAEALERALTELKHTQTQMIQNEKMSSLGQMVAGVAHEINNPVNFIYGNITHAKEYIEDILRIVKLYQRYYPDPETEIQEEINYIDLEFLIDDLPKLLDSMKVGADRIQKIVLSLRTFSRLDEAEMKEVDIHEGLNSTLMILQNRLKAKPDHPEIKVIKNYGKLPLINCYAGQLNQVFMNILANSIDSFEEVNNKLTFEEIKLKNNTITIETNLIKKNEKDWLEVKISDNGCGMTAETKKHLFDPFFTTKKVGQGTGLGLSISHSIIVEKHQGILDCISQVNEGTTFIIQIPINLKIV